MLPGFHTFGEVKLIEFQTQETILSLGNNSIKDFCKLPLGFSCKL